MGTRQDITTYIHEKWRRRKYFLTRKIDYLGCEIKDNTLRSWPEIFAHFPIAHDYFITFPDHKERHDIKKGEIKRRANYKLRLFHTLLNPARLLDDFLLFVRLVLFRLFENGSKKNTQSSESVATAKIIATLVIFTGQLITKLLRFICDIPFQFFYTFYRIYRMSDSFKQPKRDKAHEKWFDTHTKQTANQDDDELDAYECDKENQQDCQEIWGKILQKEQQEIACEKGRQLSPEYDDYQTRYREKLKKIEQKSDQEIEDILYNNQASTLPNAQNLYEVYDDEYDDMPDLVECNELCAYHNSPKKITEKLQNHPAKQTSKRIPETSTHPTPPKVSTHKGNHVWTESAATPHLDDPTTINTQTSFSM